MIQKIHPLILVGAGGLFGAISRSLIIGALSSYKLIPLGTLLVNIIGSFFLGFLITAINFGKIDAEWIPLIGVGYMGSFTTMSSFAIETLDLSTDHSFEIAFLNFGLMMLLVFLGAICGKIAASLIFHQG